MARRRQRAAAKQAALSRQRPSQPRPAGDRLRRSLHRFVRRRTLLITALLITTHIAFALLTFEPRPHTGGDNGAYITLGRSLAQHGTYTELWDPAEPPHTKYPPVFPGMLALALLVGLKPWVQLKFVVLACSAAAVALTFLWIRARRRPLLALSIASILAVAPGVLREGRWILSDVPFWAFTMLALWSFERLRRDDWKRFAIAAAATLLAYFTRSAGLPLALAALAWLAWRRHWQQLAALVLIIGIPAVLWWLRSNAYGPSGYVSEFWLINPYEPALGRIGAGDLLLRIVSNARKYLAIHMPILLTGGSAQLLFTLSAIVVVLAAFGWAWRVRRARVAELFLPLYLGLLFIWPDVWSGERFLLPALPLLLLLAGEALVRLVRRLAGRQAFPLTAAAAGLLLLLALPGLVRALKVGRECTSAYLAGSRYPCLAPNVAEFFTLSELTGQMLPDSAVVVTRKPRLYYPLSGLQSVTFPLTEDPSAFFATVDSAGARYVMFDRLDVIAEYYLRPVLLRRPEAFCVMRSHPNGTVLFGIRTDHAAAPDLGAAGEASAAQLSFAVCGAEYWKNTMAQQIYSGQAR